MRERGQLRAPALKAGPTCRVCVHPERKAIEAEIIRGRPDAEVGAKWRIAATRIAHHRRSCLARIMAYEAPLRAARERIDVLSAAERVMQEAARLGQLAEETEDIRAALLAVREYARGAELVHRLQGAKVEGQDIERDPKWIELRDTILGAIGACASCTARVVSALDALRETGGVRNVG